jgi:hypothetical protein
MVKGRAKGRTRAAALATVFILSSMVSFSLAHTRPARAGVRTVPFSSCDPTYDSQTYLLSYRCSFTMGTDFPTSALTGMYVDFIGPLAGTTTSMEISRYSFTGTYSNDVLTGTWGPGNHDVFMAATNVKQNPSVYDYVYAGVWNTQGIFGMALTNSL